MSPPGNIVVATDFTQHAADALARAARLPIGRGCHVTILHVVPSSYDDRIGAHLDTAARTLMSRAEAAFTAEALRANRPDIACFAVAADGRPADEVVERARHERASLVVIGRGARHGLGERVLGSTAERIVRGCETDVLIVGRAPDGPYRQPLVAVDLSDASERAIAGALGVADAAVREVAVVHAFDAPYLPTLAAGGVPQEELDRYLAGSEQAARKRLERWIEQIPKLPVRLAPLLRFGDARRVILEEAERRGVDLVAIGSRRHSRIGGILVGGVAEHVARHATHDVLVVR
jgi:nucleotide-binding universal stress UspA family protein